MASLGHEVVGIDVDRAKVASLSHGIAPFYEPGLEDLLQEGLTQGRLKFTTDFAEAQRADVHFIGVGTPQRADGGGADLTYVRSAVDSLLPYLKAGDVVAGKSTVPVGTAAELAGAVEETGATLVWNPEFLREGFAVKDTVTPDRFVVGIPKGPDGERAAEIIRKVLQPAPEKATPFIVTDFATAELVKVAANAFLATKISFINAMAEIAEVTGSDVTQLADAIGYDERIGRRFLGAGIGFGGGCLPKDIRAFAARAEELGRSNSVAFLHEMDGINLRRRERAANLVLEVLGGSAVGKKVAVLGAAFKPHSDDIRDSPALDVAVRLHGLGADVVVTDPQAISNAQKAHPQLGYSDSIQETLTDADAVILVTEWDEYRRHLDPHWAGSLVRNRAIVDGRNCLDPAAWRSAGWEYRGMGRP